MACGINAEVPPQSNSSRRLQLIMAGGDYPDVIRFMDIRDKSYLGRCEKRASSSR